MSNIRIVEMGARDGLQNEKSHFDVDHRIELIEKLKNAGSQHIEVGAFVSPKWVPQMEHSGEVLQYFRSKQSVGMFPKKIELISLVPNLQGFEDAIKFGASHIAVFTAASDSFSKRNTNVSIKESMKRIELVIAEAKKKKIKVRAYVSTCYYCPYEGRIKESKVLPLVEKLLDWGAYEVSIGDTIGAATPNEVRSLNKLLIKNCGKKNLAMHFHDTRGTALANILTCIEAGISSFDASVGGLGGCPYAPGAAGNVATEDVVYMAHGMGLKTGYDLEKLREIREWLAPQLGRKLHGANKFSKLGKLSL